MSTMNLKEAIDSVLTEWEKKVPVRNDYLDDGFIRPNVSGFDNSKYALEKCFAAETRAHACHYVASPISYSFQDEDNKCLHVSLVHVRMTPVDQPFIIPSESECTALHEFLQFAYSQLRFVFRHISLDFRGDIPIFRKNTLLSLGYIQISSSLTGEYTSPIDKAQSCVLDYICDSNFLRDHLKIALVRTQCIYKKITSRIIELGNLNLVT